MSNVSNSTPAKQIHGKTSKTDRGYFYVRNNKQKYRTREETYQQKRSPRQLWHTESFRFAHSEIRTIYTDPALVEQNELAYRQAMRRTPDGKVYDDAKGWKFAMLQLDWKQAHPYDYWYADYVQHISEKAAAKTQAESTSLYQLQHQLDNLLQQVQALQEQIKAKKQS